MPSRGSGSRVAAILLAAIVTAGCGGSQHKEPDVVIVNVAVTFDGHVDKLPFDPRSERLAAAMGRLAELAGRRVEFRFDVSLLPEYRSSFEDALIAAAEHAAADLLYLSEREPEVYARARSLLERIECRYDAAASQSSVVFEAPSRRLLVKLNPNVSFLLPEGFLARALSDEHEEYVARRFASISPQAVPVAERPAYFRWLSGSRALGSTANLARPDGYLEDPAALQILRIIELYRLSNEPDLRPKIREWLVERADYFTQAYVHHPALVVAAPAASAFHRAETSWISWMREALGTMTDAERLRVAKALFSKQFNDNVATYGRYPDFVFPGVDKHRFGLAIVDEWRSAGHPMTTPAAPARGSLFQFIVCQHTKEEHRRSSAQCDHDWYELSLPTPPGREQLAQAMLSRKDLEFAEAVFLNAGYGGRRIEAVVDLWRAVDREEPMWRLATRIIADEYADSNGDALLDETRRVYRLFPARRGALAYVLSQVDRYGGGKVPWSKFTSVFGAPLGQADFAAFLDMGPRAMAAVPVVWPAVTPGAFRARALVDRLDAYLDDPIASRRDPQGPWVMMRAVVAELCKERRTDELATLHAAFEARSTRKPSELRAFSNLIEDTRPGGCR
jgi:hypothetical protein